MNALTKSKIAAILTSCLTLATATPIFAQQTIVESRMAPAQWDIFIMDENGENRLQMTRDVAPDYNPTLSPDGRWLVFTSDRAGEADLWVIDMQSSDKTPTRLSFGTEFEDAASFSPNGKLLAYVSDKAGNADIYIAPFDKGKLDESQAKQITRHTDGDFNPSFSPDGKKLVFSSGRDAQNRSLPQSGAPEDDYLATEIYIYDLATQQTQRITTNSDWDGMPSWSANGDSILFYSNQEKSSSVYRYSLSDGQTLKIDGIEASQVLAPTEAAEGNLLFNRKTEKGWQIVKLNQNGETSELTAETNSFWDPSWNANSGQIVAYGVSENPLGEKFDPQMPGEFVQFRRSVDIAQHKDIELRSIRGYLPDINPLTGELLSNSGFAALAVTDLQTGNHSYSIDAKVIGQQMIWAPQWLAQQNAIIFTSGFPFAGNQAQSDIVKLNLSSRKLDNLTSHIAGGKTFANISNDEKWLAFRGVHEGKNRDIFAMNMETGKHHRISTHDAVETMPAWSNSGDKMVFTSYRDGDFELYLAELDADKQVENLQRLTHSPGRDMHAQFSADDKWVVFTSQRGGYNDERPAIPVFGPNNWGEIFALRLADKKVVRLTHNKFEDGQVIWHKQ